MLSRTVLICRAGLHFSETQNVIKVVNIVSQSGKSGQCRRPTSLSASVNCG